MTTFCSSTTLGAAAADSDASPLAGAASAADGPVGVSSSSSSLSSSSPGRLKVTAEALPASFLRLPSAVKSSGAASDDSPAAPLPFPRFLSRFARFLAVLASAAA